MKQVLALFLVLLPFIATAQVRIMSQAERQAEPKQETTIVPYDSIDNIPQDLHRLVGQELFLVPKVKPIRSFGYKCFTNEHGNNVGSVDHELVAGHTFKVVDVIDCIGYNRGKTILKLSDENDNSVYYANIKENEEDSQFLMLGYKAKYESINKGRGFYMSSLPSVDFITGRELKADQNTIWNFQEIIINESFGGFAYLFTNAQGETVVLTYYSMKNILTSVEDMEKQKSEYNAKIKKLKKKYGVAMVNTALDGKIKIGMPEELVIIAWGEPTRINRSSYGDQWVYGYIDAQYVYFENGKVKAWN